MKRIAVVMAMSAEASPVLTALSAEAATGVAPLVVRWFTSLVGACNSAPSV